MKTTRGAQHDCEAFLQRCFEEYDFSESFTPVEEPSCEECRNTLTVFREDSERLRAHFAAMPVPDMPVLPLRDPLSAASGHPRRVSTNVLPIVWLVALLVLLGVFVAFGQLLKAVIDQR